MRKANGKPAHCGANSGSSLISVLIIAGLSVTLYAAAALWTANSVSINNRNNVYNSTVAAAEASTEMALTYLESDFLNQSFRPNSLDRYRSQIPRLDWAADYRFTDGAGGYRKNWIESSAGSVMTNLDSQFKGLYGMAYSCRIRSSASPRNTPYNLSAMVQQDVQLAAIPIFQFAIFYQMNLEINPGPAMQITGKVHSNGTLYTAPGASLEYMDAVTAVGQIINNRDPNDPQYGSSFVAPVYDKEKLEKVSALNLPICTNNSSTAVRAILQVPPAGEDASSVQGQQRLYNRVDLIVTTTATRATVKAGLWGHFAELSPDAGAVGTNPPTTYSFVTTNASFYDQREGKMTLTTEIDVAALGRWITNAVVSLNESALVSLGHQLNSIYVDDQRVASDKLTVVRVKNGEELPPQGLTVATSLPLYVQGHYNVPASAMGTTNTSLCKPAALLGDAITVLSADWLDSNASNSTSKVTQRVAVDTTVNAAILGGIVPTGNYGGTKRYSGGVENFPRFLENWGGKVFTYNGSMVVMFESQFATNFWNSPGTGAANYYNAPTRHWAFDTNFRDYSRLPPVTPQMLKTVRGRWQVLAAQ